MFDHEDELRKIKQTFIPKIIVYNPQSLSSVFRIVVTPNRQLPNISDPSQKLSFNNCVRDYNLNLPSIEIISILHGLAIIPTTLDIKDEFRALRNSPSTALSGLNHYYKAPKGYPCIADIH